MAYEAVFINDDRWPKEKMTSDDLFIVRDLIHQLIEEKANDPETQLAIKKFWKRYNLLEAHLDFSIGLWCIGEDPEKPQEPFQIAGIDSDEEQRVL